MAGPFENLHVDSRSVHRAEDQVAHSLEAVRKMTADVGEGSIKFVREHPVETGSTLCLVGFCLKNPAIREAVQETIEGTSARVAVGIDDAIMATRREVSRVRLNKSTKTLIGFWQNAEPVRHKVKIASPIFYSLQVSDFWE
jgi:hypothetical protein